jgi:transcriptional regulator with XRE-family HTH domain
VNAPVTSRAFSPGRRVRVIVERLGLTVDSVARHCGVARPKLSAALNGASELRADWLEAMPVAVVREYVTELAASIGLDVVPQGNATGARDLHTLVRESADVLRAATVSEADGHVDVNEATEELRELRELERAIADRKAWLQTVVAQRGAAVPR